MNFIARLAALIPRPRTHLTRYHGVFAPNFKHRRRRIIPIPIPNPNPAHQTTREPHASRRTPMTWMQRLNRVFHIDIEHCGVCGATLWVIACIATPLKCRSRSDLAWSSKESSPISPRARPAASITPAHRRCVRVRSRTPSLPITDPTLSAPALRHSPVAPRFLRPSASTALLTDFHHCRLQIASLRPRSVCSRTDIEPDNDHADTPTTMSIDGLFFLSVRGSMHD